MEDTDIISLDIENTYITESLKVSVSKHLLDEHFTLIAANDRFYEMFGYSKEEYASLFHNHSDVFYADDPANWEEFSSTVMTAVANGESGYTYIGRMKHKNGSKIWIKLNAYFIDEVVNGYQVSYSVMMDISSLMQSRIERDVTQNIFPGLISKYRIRKNGYELVEGNQRFYKKFDGYKLSFTCHEIDGSSAFQDFCALHKDLRQGQSASFTITLNTKSEKECYLKINAECIDWIKEDPVYLLLYTDITDLMMQRKKLEAYNRSVHALAYTDEVTRGYNRRKFDITAAEAIKANKAGTYTLIWLNLKKFNLINNTEGIEAGDRTLKFIYDQIHAVLLEGEFAARFFSDNFVILMKEREDKVIESRIREIADRINIFNLHKEYKYFLTFRAGIYPVDDIELPIATMEDHAHTASKYTDTALSDLYVCNFYKDQLLLALIQEREIENIMRDSLQKDEFQVYLQPKFSIRKQAIYGAEALIRWKHPTRGLLSPNIFIPLFEKNGFIVDVDLYVFERVCQLLQKWKEEGRDLHPISVNMSRAHFSKKDFLQSYVKIKDKYQISSTLLEIELTETMVFEEPEMFGMIISEIHKAGFRCSMDDFGSGYSSLGMLKSLELDVLKLDKTFFSAERMDNEKENIIISSIIKMTQSLHMLTVAEGIETKEQLKFLEDNGCDFIQGYVISKPVPIQEFELLVRAVDA